MVQVYRPFAFAAVNLYSTIIIWSQAASLGDGVRRQGVAAGAGCVRRPHCRSKGRGRSCGFMNLVIRRGETDEQET